MVEDSSLWFARNGSPWEEGVGGGLVFQSGSKRVTALFEASPKPMYYKR